MIYFLAALMGCIIAKNIRVWRAAQHDTGESFASPTARLLLSVGGFAGWFCILPAAYFAASVDGNSFFQGFLFAFAALGGSFIAGITRIPGPNELIAILALPLNVGLAALVYYLTRYW